MSISSFLSSIFNSRSSKTISVDGLGYVPVNTAELQSLAYYIAVDYIASAVSLVEWRTFIKDRENFGDEYYRWNTRANSNNSGADFWADAIRKLYANPDSGILIIPHGSDLLLADSFVIDERALYDNAFSQVTVGTYTFPQKFYQSDVLWINFGNDCRLKAILRSYCSTFEDVFGNSINKYKMSDGERGTLEIDSTAAGDEDTMSRIAKLLNEDFRTYFNSNSAVVPIYSGTKYTAVKNNTSQSTSIVNDIVALAAEIFAKTGQALKVPPALMIGETADVSGAVKNFLTFGIDPLVKKIAAEGNRVLFGKEVLTGSGIRPDLSKIEHVTPFEIAEKIDKLIADGIYCPNEIRRLLCEPRINETWADEYSQTKNYQTVSEKK